MNPPAFFPARTPAAGPSPWLLALLAAAAWLVPAARAQTIYTRDGQAVVSQGLRRDGDTVIARIQTPGGSPGDIGYPVANIARIDFPEPAQLKIAGDLLAAGRADEAARQIAPILAYFAPFRDVAGNFWTPLALLQADALARLGGRDRELDALVADLARFGAAASPDFMRSIRLKQAAAIERRGDHAGAIAALEPLLKDPAAAPETLTEGWLAFGQAQLEKREYRAALLAFLHVPVYSPDRVPLMAPALLGSANAYVGLDDRQRAQTTLKDLIVTYPSSPEAARAKDRLRAIAAPTPKPAGG